MVWYHKVMKTIHRDIVGAFIVSADEKMLLGHNKKGGVYQGVLVIPGGGIEEGETKIEALAREIWEEVKIDIASADIKELGESSGESEKYIKELGEVALVKMTFFDYEVRLVQPANEIEAVSEDDFEFVGWFPLSELNSLHLGPATRATLARVGYVDASES